MNPIKKLGLAAIIAGSVVGCIRPTNQESVAWTDLNNNFYWGGMGPQIEWRGPTETEWKVSHKRQIVNIPLEDYTKEQKEEINNAADTETQNRIQAKYSTDLEKEQSIVTSDKFITIVEMQIGYQIIPTAKTVETYYMTHREEDRPRMLHDMVGLARAKLQTYSYDEIQKNQATLGDSIKAFINTYAPAGKSLSQQWGIDVKDAKIIKIRLPSYVINEYSNAEQVVKKAEQLLESSASDAQRRLSKLDGMKELISKVGNDNKSIEYLNFINLMEGAEDSKSAVKELQILYGIKPSPTLNLGNK